NRRALVEAAETDTAVTRAFDVAKGLPWPARFPSRVLANDFVERWTGREETLDAGACEELAAAIAAGDCRVAPVDAGQGVGMIRNDATVAEVIDEMCSGAEQLLSRWGS
ncbi:nitronate monooxygenase, partial [Mycobacterium avium]|nr:nitronate monooxygenase [Mycobacterium avium]